MFFKVNHTIPLSMPFLSSFLAITTNWHLYRLVKMLFVWVIRDNFYKQELNALQPGRCITTIGMNKSQLMYIIDISHCRNTQDKNSNITPTPDGEIGCVVTVLYHLCVDI